MSNEAALHDIVEMINRELYLKESHKYAVSQTTDGRYYTWVGERKARKQIRAKTKEELYKKLEKYYKETSRKTTVQYTMGDIFKLSMRHLMEFGRRQNTIGRYERTYNRYFLGTKIERMDIAHVTEDDLENYLRDLIGIEQLTQRQYSDVKTLLNAMFGYAYKQKLTAINIRIFWDGFYLPIGAFKRKVRSTDKEVFSNGDAAKLVDYLKSVSGKPEYLAIRFCFETGLRAGEMSALRFDDIDFENGVLRLTSQERRDEANNEGCSGKHAVYEIADYTKGRDGARNVVLTDEAINILKEMSAIHHGEFVFMHRLRLEQSKWERFHAAEFNRKLALACEHASVPRRSFHKIRKTYISRLSAAGLPEAFIRAQVGHTDYRTTREYYIFNVEDLQKQRRRLEIALDV